MISLIRIEDTFIYIQGRLREDARRKLITNYLTQILFQNQNSENKLVQNVHKMSSYSITNILLTARLVETLVPRILITDDNGEKITLLNDTCNSERS